MSRAVRHVAFAAASLLLLAAAAGAALRANPRAEGIFLASFASAWAAFAFLAATLVPGALSLLRGRPSPVSTMLRRDLGIWSAVLALVHTVLGLQVHMRGRMLHYFTKGDPLPRLDLFGFANWTGLAATVLLAGLLALSNDRSLRRLGAARWKSLQRWAYTAALLVAVHGVAYQVLEKRTAAWVVALIVVVLAVAALQLAGVRRFRAQRRGGPASGG